MVLPRSGARSFVRSVAATSDRLNMFEKGETVVVGVSGGADSVALLHALVDLNAILCCELTVAHLDHNLRPSSARDRVFVRDLCRRLGVAFISETLKAPRDAKLISEDVLRRQRYAFFLRACRKAGSRKLALAHTRDDQAETVLMRVLRGTGLYGLSGILPVLKKEGYTVVRPLIEKDRLSILRFLKTRKAAWRTDPTNRDTRYLRNKVRHELLPILEKGYNPGVRDALAGLAATTTADYLHMERCGRALLERAAKRKAGSVRCALGPLRRADAGLRRTALRLAVRDLCGHLRRFTWAHWSEVEDLVLYRPSGSEVHLPQGLRALKKDDKLVFFAKKQ